MKAINKLATVASSLVLLTGIAYASIGASALNVPGQIEGGDQNYQIEDITTNSGFANPQNANQCDMLEYRLRLYNPGPNGLSDVKLEAGINTMTAKTSAQSMATAYTPDGINPQTSFTSTVNFPTAQTQSYVKGSTQLLDSAGNVLKSSANGTLADTITMGGGGIDLGSIGESITEYVEFQTKVSCPTPVTPSYSCDELDIAAESNRTVKITTFNTTATNGATFTNADINWGDNNSSNSLTNLVGQTHQYGADGTYTVAATAHFSVNGKDVTASGPACEKTVTFSSTTPPTVTPPAPTVTPPTQLVNTGPGSVVGIAAAAIIAGVAFYRRMLGRKLSRQ